MSTERDAENFVRGMERIGKIVKWRKRWPLFARLPYSWQVWCACHL